MIGVYVSPNISLVQFEDWLDGVRDCTCRCALRPLIIAGDFNAKSCMWGSLRTNARSEVVEEWAETLSLSLINRGSSSTLVRTRGESVVDLTWANPAAARAINGWKVMDNLETLSDHLYIIMEIRAAPPSFLARRRQIRARSRRWALSRLDGDMFAAAVQLTSWTETNWTNWDIDRKVEWFQDVLTRVCDASMTRAGARSKKTAYW